MTNRKTKRKKDKNRKDRKGEKGSSLIQLDLNMEEPYLSRIKPKPFETACPNCQGNNLALNEEGEIICDNCQTTLDFEADEQGRRKQAQTLFDLIFNGSEKKEEKASLPALQKAVDLLKGLENKEQSDLEMMAFLYKELGDQADLAKERIAFYQKAVSMLDQVSSMPGGKSAALLYFQAHLYSNLGRFRMNAGDELAMSSFKAGESLITPLYRKSGKQRKLLYGWLLESILQGETFLLLQMGQAKQAIAMYQKLFSLMEQEQEQMPELYEWSEEILLNAPLAISLFYQSGRNDRARRLGTQVFEAALRRFEKNRDENSFALLMHVLIHTAREAIESEAFDDFEYFIDLSQSYLAQGEKLGLTEQKPHPDDKNAENLERDLALYAFLLARKLASYDREEEAIELLRDRLQSLKKHYPDLGQSEEISDSDLELLSFESNLARGLYSLLAERDQDSEKEERVALLERLYEIEEAYKKRLEPFSEERMNRDKNEFSFLLQLLEEYSKDEEEEKGLEIIDRIIESVNDEEGSVHIQVKGYRDILNLGLKLSENQQQPQRTRMYREKLQAMKDLNEEAYVSL